MNMVLIYMALLENFNATMKLSFILVILILQKLKKQMVEI
jgi:hypothetical protein